LAAPRIRHTTTRKETESVRDDYMTQGFEVLREGENSVLLRKSTWGSVTGHVVVAILTAWWTLGLGNVLYGVVAHVNAEQVMIKQDEGVLDTYQ
jgi:hypothetical protein